MLQLGTMLGIALAVTGCVATSKVEPGMNPGDTAVSEQIKKYQDHFKRQSLPYINPLGCSDDAPCSLAADFNDDGTIDYVALYEYSGSKRRGAARYIDLVFVYSIPGSSEAGQQVFTRVGKIDDKNQTAISLEIQPPGVLKLPIGQIELERNGVNLIPTDRPPNLYSPTFYWNGEKFYSIVKEGD
jgi:hypothetical protein